MRIRRHRRCRNGWIRFPLSRWGSWEIRQRELCLPRDFSNREDGVRRIEDRVCGAWRSGIRRGRKQLRWRRWTLGLRVPNPSRELTRTNQSPLSNPSLLLILLLPLLLRRLLSAKYRNLEGNKIWGKYEPFASLKRDSKSDQKNQRFKKRRESRYFTLICRHKIYTWSL